MSYDCILLGIITARVVCTKLQHFLLSFEFLRMADVSMEGPSLQSLLLHTLLSYIHTPTFKSCKMVLFPEFAFF